MNQVAFWEIAGLVLLVAASAFFSASEAALISVSRIRARAMVEHGLKRARTVLAIVDNRNRFLTSVLIGNTIVLLAADSLATYIFIKLQLPAAAVLSTVVMTIVLLLFGEILPKTIAVSDSERWALRLSPAMKWVGRLLTPLVVTFQLIADFVLRPFGIKHAHHLFVTEEDIRTLVSVGAEQRVIEEKEKEMIHSIIEFGDTIVREVMTPRPEMVAVSIDATPRRALDMVIAEGYSKLPIYQESKDDIIGVVHDRELLIALANGSLAQSSLRSLMRPIAHVPESKKISDLLREMQRDKFTMAIVVDEYGGTAGLVTMEDVLEEIVGEIRDEHDTDEQEPIRFISDMEAVIDAGVNIEDVNSKLGTHLPTEDFETIGGYLVGLFGRLPKEGDEIAADEHTRLRVDHMRGRRIVSVRLFSTNGRAIGTNGEEPAEAEHDAAER